MKQTSNKKYTAPALEKGLDILELLAKSKISLTIGEIAEQLHRSKSEIFRMIVVLEERGYLAKEVGQESFTITNHIFEIGLQISPVSTLLEVALPQMRRFTEEIRQSCHLAVLNKSQIVVIARIESPSAIGVSVKPGYSMQAYQTGSGKTFLAWGDQAVQNQILQGLGIHHDDKKLVKELKKICKQGYVINPSSFMTGMLDISAPIIKRGTVIAAITIPFIHNSNTPIEPESIGVLLKNVASQITEQASQTSGI